MSARELSNWNTATIPASNVGTLSRTGPANETDPGHEVWAAPVPSCNYTGPASRPGRYHVLRITYYVPVRVPGVRDT